MVRISHEFKVELSALRVDHSLSNSFRAKRFEVESSDLGFAV